MKSFVRELVEDLWDNDGVKIGALILGLLLFLGTVLYWSIENDAYAEARWNEFVRHHKCVIVAREESKTLITSKGDLVVVPEKTTWKCDDGITYTR